MRGLTSEEIEKLASRKEFIYFPDFIKINKLEDANRRWICQNCESVYGAELWEDFNERLKEYDTLCGGLGPDVNGKDWEEFRKKHKPPVSPTCPNCGSRKWYPLDLYEYNRYLVKRGLRDLKTWR